MSKVYAFLANGMEEVELLSVVDLLRRAKVDTQMISISDQKLVTGSHNITVLADACFDEVDFSDADMLFLPGGVPGVPNLAACESLAQLLQSFAKDGKRLAAICAAPSILGDLGILKGRRCTCYPGWESHLEGAIHTTEGVVTDGNITTARGMGFGVDMGLELVSILCGTEVAETLKKGIQHPQA